MKSRLSYCMSLITFFFSLPGCTKLSIDVNERPNDYRLDYWLNDTIKFDELVNSSFYALKYDHVYTYLDSNYSFAAKENVKALPSYYVTYDVYVEDQNSKIQAIFITDPEVSIYGLSLKSNPSTINRTLLNMGFEYFDQYRGWYPSYSKDQYLFTFIDKKIILSILSAGLHGRDGIEI